MGTIKDDALEIAGALVSLENEHGISPNNPLHTKLNAALEEHADELGLSPRGFRR